MSSSVGECGLGGRRRTWPRGHVLFVMGAKSAMPDVETIAPAVEAVVVAHGLELYDVELTGPHRRRNLRILVDRDGGVDLETISGVSDALSRVLDADPTVAQVCPG